MTLKIELPRDRAAPLGWVSEVVFGEMLGLHVDIAETSGADVVVSAEERRLVIASHFPDLDADRGKWQAQLPMLPLASLDLDAAGLAEANVDRSLPVLYGSPRVEFGEADIRCRLDLLGSVFFMLSRFEEMVLPDRDEFDRFPGIASTAWKGGFLYRPIVDEYVELLWALMKRLWPGIERRRREGTVKVSCDVDQPIDRIRGSAVLLAKVLRHEFFVSRRPRIGLSRAVNYFASPLGVYRFDPFDTFDWYLDTCEHHGRRAAFYFLCDNTAGGMDGDYSLDEPRILDLIRKVGARGHEIGMHGSFNTFRNPGQMRKERRRLVEAGAAAGLEIEATGNRQHYLRWDAAETPDHLDMVGFGHDTTGSFADRPGFRYGTAHPFAMWSWKRLHPIRLRQQPLVLMECSVIGSGYLGLGYRPEALDLMVELKHQALRLGGDFTLLWHNSHFMTAKDREFFKTLLA